MSHSTDRQSANHAHTASPGASHAAQAGSQAPGASDPNRSQQASAGMPSRRALETGARGWRWTLGVSILALLPFAAMAETVGLESIEHRIERGTSLVDTMGTVELGSPLASREQARRHLRAGAAAQVVRASWSDRYFDMGETAEAADRPMVAAGPGLPDSDFVTLTLR